MSDTEISVTQRRREEDLADLLAAYQFSVFPLSRFSLLHLLPIRLNLDSVIIPPGEHVAFASDRQQDRRAAGVAVKKAAGQLFAYRVDPLPVPFDDDDLVTAPEEDARGHDAEGGGAYKYCSHTYGFRLPNQVR